jgi:hypothetical protein
VQSRCLGLREVLAVGTHRLDLPFVHCGQDEIEEGGEPLVGELVASPRIGVPWLSNSPVTQIHHRTSKRRS